MCLAARSVVAVLALALVHLIWLGGACSKSETKGESPPAGGAAPPAVEPASSPAPATELPATPVSPDPASQPLPVGKEPPPATKPAGDVPSDEPVQRPAGEPGQKPREDPQRKAASLPAQGETCDEGRCGNGLTCIEYYGIAGAAGPRMSSCEIPCKGGKGCPAGQQCATIADGPGQVCRPEG